jgi:2-oxo-4-hydroxy-4-carboxy-5-ureidoimidazoline decarboxylase
MPVVLDTTMLNSLDQASFVEAIGWVFEDSPWIAERAWHARPFASVQELLEAIRAIVETALREQQLSLLRAHPDLGTRARISAESSMEQSGAGLDALTATEFERLGRLNAAYRQKFGFPFLFAVTGSTKHDVFESLERRLSAPPEEEFREALRQVYRIAETRLRKTIK